MPNWSITDSPNVVITPWSRHSIGYKITGVGGNSLAGVASTAWPTANLAIFVPFAIMQPIVVAQLFWNNGSTVSGNVDAGIYAPDGTRLVSTGTTVQSGTSTNQVVNITDTIIGPGLFYLALAVDNTTALIRRGTAGTVAFCKMTGCAEQTTAFALPAAATLATVSNDYVPVVGLTGRSLF